MHSKRHQYRSLIFLTPLRCPQLVLWGVSQRSPRRLPQKSLSLISNFLPRITRSQIPRPHQDLLSHLCTMTHHLPHSHTHHHQVMCKWTRHRLLTHTHQLFWHQTALSKLGKRLNNYCVNKLWIWFDPGMWQRSSESALAAADAGVQNVKGNAATSRSAITHVRTAEG